MSRFFLKHRVSGRNLICLGLNVAHAHQVFLERIFIGSHCHTVADADGHFQNVINQIVVGTVGNRRIQGTLVLISGDHIIGIVGRMLNNVKT